MHTFCGGVRAGVWGFFLMMLTVSLGYADDRIPDDVAMQEIETCMKQSPKDPPWFGSVYCPCVMKETQNKITYSDYQAVTQELTTPDAAAGRPAFEKNKAAMASIARTCLVLVEKRSLREKNLTKDSVPAP